MEAFIIGNVLYQCVQPCHRSPKPSSIDIQYHRSQGFSLAVVQACLIPIVGIDSLKSKQGGCDGIEGGSGP